jgi:tetratricopeptide (TPR) repeat protein
MLKNFLFKIILGSVAVGFAGDVKICLSVIVEDDDITIAECLNSVKEIVDCIAIYDLGSTDRTLDIVQRFLTDTKIPGAIEKHPEKNLDSLEMSAMLAAVRCIERCQLAPEDTYLLALEPNMILKIAPNFQKNQLRKEDLYCLLTKGSSSSYETHLVLSQLLKEKQTESSVKSVKCHGLALEKLQSSSQHIERLKKTAQKETNNEHALFRLAQAYQELGQHEAAISWYQKRIEKNINLEEIWFSKYMLGQCYETLQKWDEALYWYLESYQANPARVEPLVKISTHYRLLGQNDLAYIFAKYGSCLPCPEDSIYFSHPSLDKYRLDEELSIVSYYTPFKEDGYAAASDLVLKRNVPHYVREQAYRNLLFYVEPLKNAVYQPVAMDLPLIKENIPYRPMNPSILKTSDGYYVICRVVNYVQEGARDFYTYDEKGIYRSRNFFLRYDSQFYLLSQKELLEEGFREKIGSPIVQGFEDCRLFEFDQRLWFTCTTTDTNPTGSFQISLCQLGNMEREDSIPVHLISSLKGPDPYRCEKNWLPFVFEGKFHTIYQYDPFTIYAPDPKTGDCECVHSYQPAYDFSRLRGSAGPIPFDEGYLVLVHEVVFLPDSRRAYVHRFLFLNQDWIVTKKSKPFIFKHIGVEYCCSMSWDHTAAKIVLPIGIEDQEAALCIVDSSEIRSMLVPF